MYDEHEPLGYSCGYPIMDWLPCGNAWLDVSAIPPVVFEAWYAGDGPHPCAWLASAVVHPPAGAAWRTIEALAEYTDADWLGIVTRRLPKGEREPGACRTYMFACESGYPCAWCYFELSNITSMPYRTTREQLACFQSCYAEHALDIWVVPGAGEPVGTGTGWIVSLGWLAREMRRRNIEGLL